MRGWATGLKAMASISASPCRPAGKGRCRGFKRGLAYAARETGVGCIICMSQLVQANKVEGIKAQGADMRIVASQSTVGLEILNQVPDVRTVLVQVSGSGLISGTAAALKADPPRIHIIGISMERGGGQPRLLERTPDHRALWIGRDHCVSVRQNAPGRRHAGASQRR